MDLPIWDISCKFNHIIGYGSVPLWDLDHKEGRTPKNWCLWTVVLEKTPESLLHSKEIKPVNLMGDQLWKDWCWSWSSSILVIWCEQLTHWKSPWCWERLRAEGEEGIRGWDGLTASPVQRCLPSVNLGKPLEVVRVRDAWQAAVHGVTKSWTWLGNWIKLNWSY